jgi:hypothetical protein
LILGIVLGVFARFTYNGDLGSTISAALDRYEDAAERHGFEVGLSDAQRRFLTDQIKQRLPVALKPLTSSSEKPDLSWPCRRGQLDQLRGRMA